MDLNEYGLENYEKKCIVFYSLSSQFNVNDQIREDAERLLLHMMSYGCTDMKRCVFDLFSLQNLEDLFV